MKSTFFSVLLVMWGLGYSRRNKRQQAESAQQEAIGGLKI